MAERSNQIGAWISCVGTLVLLGGLTWDAALHRLDPALAAREVLLVGANPGHALTAAGVALMVAGVALRLLGEARSARPARRALLSGLLGGLAALSAAVLALAAGGAAPEPHPAAATPARFDATAADFDARVAAGLLTRPEADYILRQVRSTVHPHGDPIPVTATELAAAARLVDAVREGTARLADVRAAEAEGYHPLPVGSRGSIVHFSNDAYYGRILDPERPQQVVYQRLPDGRMALVGALFLMPHGVPGPPLGGPLTAWHAHDNICADPTTYRPVGTTDAAGHCPAGAVRRTSPEMLHVWLAENPGGVFDSWMQPASLRASAP
jgi:hypothetical protein